MAFTPADLSPIGWWEANAADNYTDAGKSTNVTDTDLVYTAEDKGSNGYDLTQSDSAERPTWNDDSPDHYLFDGGDHLITTDAIEPNTSDFGFALRIKLASSAFQFIAAKGNTGSTDAGWSIFVTGGSPSYVTVRCGTGGSTNRASQQWEIGTGGIGVGTWFTLGMKIRFFAGNTIIAGFVNGSNTNWTNGGGGPTNSTYASTGAITSASDFVLGANSSGANDVANGTQIRAALAYPANGATNNEENIHRYYSGGAFWYYNLQQKAVSF